MASFLLKSSGSKLNKGKQKMITIKNTDELLKLIEALLLEATTTGGTKELDCEQVLRDAMDIIIELGEKLDFAMDIVKAVAHIGVDFGYGKFEIGEYHIERARDACEQITPPQEQN